MRILKWIKDLFKVPLAMVQVPHSKPKETSGVFCLTTKNAVFRVIKEDPISYEVSKGHFKDGKWVDVKIIHLDRRSVRIISENAARSLMKQRQVPNYKRQKKSGN